MGIFQQLLSAALISSVATIGGLASPIGNPKELANRAAGDVHLYKRFSDSRWSFYDVGLGACGEWNVESDFIVALNADQFGSGYPGPECQKTITLSYGGKTAQAKVMDRCPGCPYGGLDLSRSLFRYFASEDVGIIYGEWSFSDGSGGQAPVFTPEPAPEPTPEYQAPAAEPTTTWQAPVEPTTTWQAPVEPTTTWQAPVEEPTTTWQAPVEPTANWEASVEPTTTSEVPAPPPVSSSRSESSETATIVPSSISSSEPPAWTASEETPALANVADFVVEQATSSPSPSDWSPSTASPSPTSTVAAEDGTYTDDGNAGDDYDDEEGECLEWEDDEEWNSETVAAGTPTESPTVSPAVFTPEPTTSPLVSDPSPSFAPDQLLAEPSADATSVYSPAVESSPVASAAADESDFTPVANAAPIPSASATASPEEDLKQNWDLLSELFSKLGVMIQTLIESKGTDVGAEASTTQA
ncbi:hypothetical protein FA15DRAFT_638838 [Coprinopsis marcescibilis]|uniref:RlpA-like protein double-psi beta-barrel domain-containing protein n=1 Tax=Coprinopsis marcescibilis TaxID=230819 RepID=A0A5C3KZU7_COPMA|nr:hypothetical protein FA15DRAFT_638838 [Coprinopsis marcescibilis]